MNRKSLLNGLFWAGSFGAMVAVLTGERRAVSLRLWLAAFVIWFAFASLTRLLNGLPLLPAPIRLPVSVRRTAVQLDTSRLRELRALEGLLLRARNNDRAYAQQLQPRVVALADHFLPVTHGINRHAQPERAAELLGPLAWLLEVTPQQRTPTLDELDELLDLLTTPSRIRTEEAA